MSSIKIIVALFVSLYDFTRNLYELFSWQPTLCGSNVLCGITLCSSSGNWAQTWFVKSSSALQALHARNPQPLRYSYGVAPFRVGKRALALRSRLLPESPGLSFLAVVSRLLAFLRLRCWACRGVIKVGVL